MSKRRHLDPDETALSPYSQGQPKVSSSRLSELAGRKQNLAFTVPGKQVTLAERQ